MKRLKITILTIVSCVIFQINANAGDVSKQTITIADSSLSSPPITPNTELNSSNTDDDESLSTTFEDEPASNKDIPQMNNRLDRSTNNDTNEQLRSIEREEHPTFDSNIDTEGAKTSPQINEGVQPINKGYEQVNPNNKIQTTPNLHRQNPIDNTNNQTTQ